MKYEILIYIGYIGGVCGIIGSICLFIKLNIKKAFFDLTGLTTKKELKELKQKHQRKDSGIFQSQAGSFSDITAHDTILLMGGQEREQRKQIQKETFATRILEKNVSACEETTVLTTNGVLIEKKSKETVQNISEDFVIFTDVTVVHTDEKI